MCVPNLKLLYCVYPCKIFCICSLFLMQTLLVDAMLGRERPWINSVLVSPNRPLLNCWVSTTAQHEILIGLNCSSCSLAIYVLLILFFFLYRYLGLELLVWSQCSLWKVLMVPSINFSVWLWSICWFFVYLEICLVSQFGETILVIHLELGLSVVVMLEIPLLIRIMPYRMHRMWFQVRCV